MPTKEEVIRLLARIDAHCERAETYAEYQKADEWAWHLLNLQRLAKLAGLIT